MDTTYHLNIPVEALSLLDCDIRTFSFLFDFFKILYFRQLNLKNNKQIAAQGYFSFCLDCPHRHIVFTIPEEFRNWFRQDRTRLNLLFVASRNTISILTNKSLADKCSIRKNYRSTALYNAI